MIDPATGAIISLSAQSLTLVNALIKLSQEQSASPSKLPPSVAQLIATLPAAALAATEELAAQIAALKRECIAAGLDLGLTLDQLQENTHIWQRSRRRVLKSFGAKVEGIATQLSVLFDDVVSVADCADRLDIVARSFEASREQKQELRKAVAGNKPLGEILDGLIDHADRAKAQLGDLNRKKP